MQAAPVFHGGIQQATSGISFFLLPGSNCLILLSPRSSLSPDTGWLKNQLGHYKTTRLF
jgi:hypothetical protein